MAADVASQFFLFVTWAMIGAMPVPIKKQEPSRTPLLFLLLTVFDEVTGGLCTATFTFVSFPAIMDEQVCASVEHPQTWGLGGDGEGGWGGAGELEGGVGRFQCGCSHKAAHTHGAMGRGYGINVLRYTTSTPEHHANLVGSLVPHQYNLVCNTCICLLPGGSHLGFHLS